ncbi:tyrosine-type recombinase/integrase [Mycolicibacterium sp. CBM1]
MYFESDGSECSAGTFDTEKAAANAARDAEKLVTQGRSPVSLRDAGKEKFAVVATEWLDAQHDLKASTRAEYTNLLAKKTRARKNADGTSTAGLSIAATFGVRQINSVARKDIAAWVGALVKAGKSASTVRHHYFVVKAVLDHAVADGRVLDNVAVGVKLPSERTVANSSPGVVDDPDMFLSAMQVAALVDATPWPCSVLVHLAAWSGLRAGELCGLQVGDIDWPMNPNGTVWLRVRRTVSDTGGELTYDTTKTKGSNRRVPLRSATAQLLRDYLAEHPRADEPTAPLFCAVTLSPVKPTGKRRADDNREEPETAAQKADRQATALAALSVAEATDRLVLDWTAKLRHQTFYKAVFRPAVLRANRLARESNPTALAGDQADVLPGQFKFHGLRHTYASLCAAAGLPVEKVSQYLGHSKTSTTLDIYVHLFRTDDASDDMAALDSMDTPTVSNVVTLRQRG